MSIVSGRDQKLFWPILGLQKGSRKSAAWKMFTALPKAYSLRADRNEHQEEEESTCVFILIFN